MLTDSVGAVPNHLKNRVLLKRMGALVARVGLFELLVCNRTSRADGRSVHDNIIVVVKLAALCSVGYAWRRRSSLGEPSVFMAQDRAMVTVFGIVH